MSSDSGKKTAFYGSRALGEMPSGAEVEILQAGVLGDSPADTLIGIEQARVYRTDRPVPGLEELESNVIITDFRNRVLNFYLKGHDGRMDCVEGQVLLPHKEVEPGGAFQNFNRVPESAVYPHALEPGTRIYSAKVAAPNHEQLTAFNHYAVVVSLSYRPRVLIDAVIGEFLRQVDEKRANVRRIREAIDRQIANLRRGEERQIAALPVPDLAFSLEDMLVKTEED